VVWWLSHLTKLSFSFDFSQACNIAATKALREADVIVSTSTGASDPRLLAACGIMTDEDEALDQDKRLPSSRPQEAKASSTTRHISRQVAPDSLPPLSLPFVIVDEACQSVEPATLIPITSTNSCRALVLLGDPCQLPPTVKTSTSSPLSVSLMERLAATLPQPVIVTGQSDLTEKDERFLQSKPTMQARSFIRAMDKEGRQRSSYRKRFSGSLLLSIQYRMHPSISAFSSAVFYDGLLATPTFLESQRLFPEALLDEESGPTYTKTSVRFINVGGPNNERRGARGKLSTDSLVVSGDENSYWNQQEADQVIALLKKLLTEKSAVEGEGPPTIGVVTPYNGQVELIKSLISSDRELKDLTDNLAEPIEVKSVDGYQGRERDVIIFSAVRSNRQAKVGFLSDWRRMNVALTRARSALLVIGDFETLSVGDKHWAAFGNWCRAMNCLQELNDESTDEKISS
jgi:senataxin